MAKDDVQMKDAGEKPKAKDSKVEEPEALSEEDQALKTKLDSLVEKLADQDAGMTRGDLIELHGQVKLTRDITGVQKESLQSMIGEIKAATASMTSVPKPLKFLNAHTDLLQQRCIELASGDNKKLLADICSVLATTIAPKEGERAALRFCLLGTKGQLENWGHEYLRHLAGEIAEEFNVRCLSTPSPHIPPLKAFLTLTTLTTPLRIVTKSRSQWPISCPW